MGSSLKLQTLCQVHLLVSNLHFVFIPARSLRPSILRGGGSGGLAKNRLPKQFHPKHGAGDDGVSKESRGWICAPFPTGPPNECVDIPTSVAALVGALTFRSLIAWCSVVLRGPDVLHLPAGRRWLRRWAAASWWLPAASAPTARRTACPGPLSELNWKPGQIGCAVFSSFFRSVCSH